MAYRRGFKTEAHGIAEEIRAELGLHPLDALDPRRLAELLEVPIVGLSEMVRDAPVIAYLLHTERSVFSAVTVFRGPRRLIVHNDGHAMTRQNSNLSHELAHALLLHTATPALDDRGSRLWNEDLEDEAAWLAGALLISEAATIEIARGRWTRNDAAIRFAVSERMVQFRMNATGAVKRVSRMRGLRLNEEVS
jgi:Zn-dependent peptidase ImmA (M78 family)